MLRFVVLVFLKKLLWFGLCSVRFGYPIPHHPLCTNKIELGSHYKYLESLAKVDLGFRLVEFEFERKGLFQNRQQQKMQLIQLM